MERDWGLAPALVLDGRITAGAALLAMAPLTDASYVVVLDRRRRPRHALHQKGILERLCSRVVEDTPLHQLLRLDELPPARAVDVLEQGPATRWRDLPSGTVVFNGQVVLGVVLAPGRTRHVDTVTGAPRPPSIRSRSAPSRPPHPPRGSAPSPR